MKIPGAKRRSARWMPILSLVGFLVLAVIGSGAVLAHGGAMGVVKERMKMMSFMEKRMRTMNSMLNGKSPYHPERISNQSGAIARAMQDYARLFPEGSTDEPSEALPKIWKEWRRFSELAGELTSEAQSLRESAMNQGRGAANTMVQRIGRLCDSCHESFRRQEDE